MLLPPSCRLLEIQWWRVVMGGGGLKNGKLTLSLSCRATLTHSRAPAANFTKSMCHPCCEAQGALYLSTL